jgi:acetyl esterase
MSTTADASVVLEPESQEFVEATSTPPLLYELTPTDARKVLDDVQAAPIDKLPVDDRWITVPAEVGDVRVRIVRPPDDEGTLPVILPTQRHARDACRRRAGDRRPTRGAPRRDDNEMKG